MSRTGGGATDRWYRRGNDGLLGTVPSGSTDVDQKITVPAGPDSGLSGFGGWGSLDALRLLEMTQGLLVLRLG